MWKMHWPPFQPVAYWGYRKRKSCQRSIHTVGVKRRFEYHVQSESIVYIDDYAHHPRELEAMISSARQLFPDRKMVVVFQPHLYSRTRDFANEFSKVLDKADEVILVTSLPCPGTADGWSEQRNYFR
ncbi:MAG: cyanophycin synthetase [Puia sp.]